MLDEIEDMPTCDGYDETKVPRKKPPSLEEEIEFTARFSKPLTRAKQRPPPLVKPIFNIEQMHEMTEYDT